MILRLIINDIHETNITVFEKDIYKIWKTKLIDKAFESDYSYFNWFLLKSFFQSNISIFEKRYI